MCLKKLPRVSVALMDRCVITNVTLVTSLIEHYLDALKVTFTSQVQLWKFRGEFGFFQATRRIWWCTLRGCRCCWIVRGSRGVWMHSTTRLAPDTMLFTPLQMSFINTSQTPLIQIRIRSAFTFHAQNVDKLGALWMYARQYSPKRDINFGIYERHFMKILENKRFVSSSIIEVSSKIQENATILVSHISICSLRCRSLFFNPKRLQQIAIYSPK